MAEEEAMTTREPRRQWTIEICTEGPDRHIGEIMGLEFGPSHAAEAVNVVELGPDERVISRAELRQIMLDDYDGKSADRHLNKLFGDEK